jgi:tRNA-(ms[2]io[6]A)-hydroxylase
VSAVSVTPSSESWVQAALADLPTLLIDHAHCEKKAASTAIRFLFKYPDWPSLVSAMSKLAREELLHFDRVLRELEARAVPFRGLGSANYAAGLFAAARAEEPARRVDEMLCCALIEARSHERFVRLGAALRAQVPAAAPATPQAKVAATRLAAFYEELADAEARHGDLYVELAEEAAGGDVSRRLAELSAHEAAVVARPNQPLRMHAGG